MAWTLILTGIALVALGIDGLRLSQGLRRPSNKVEEDKRLFGASPTLPESARAWLRDRYAVRADAVPLISWLLVLLGLVLSAAGVGWLPVP